jgi:putative SOS response-associated peptidase YedK
MFRDAFRRRRCLVVADGFYEWRENDERRRTLFFFRLGRARRFRGHLVAQPREKRIRLATCALVPYPPNGRLNGITWHHFL